jgi:hypothetical protein
MSKPKKRRAARKPLTYQEELAGERYYTEVNPETEGDLEKIRKSFKARPDLDQADFERRLEEAAWWYAHLADAKSVKWRPSERARKWGSIASRAKSLLSEFDGGDESLPKVWPLYLHQAAHRLTKRTGALPDFEVERIPLPTSDKSHQERFTELSVGPVEDQVEKCIDSLRWFRDCVAEAEAIAIDEKASTGGNRADEARQYLYESLVDIYWRSADLPKRPWCDSRTEKPKGEAIKFLKATLHALGVMDGPHAIYAKSRGLFPKPPKKPGAKRR